MMRGVEKQHSSTITSSMLGAFREKETRDEFCDHSRKTQCVLAWKPATLATGLAASRAGRAHPRVLPVAFRRWGFAYLWSLNPMRLTADSGPHNGPLSSALARTFQGKLCDVILRNRSVATFEKDQVIYDAGDENRTFFFLQTGFVKVGSITEDGRELIYDVRKAGDIVGELCASGAAASGPCSSA